MLDSTATVTYNPTVSETDIPLTAPAKYGAPQNYAYTQGQGQQQAYGVYAPQPRRPQQPPPPPVQMGAVSLA